MYIQRIGTNHYRLRETYNGKTYSKYFKYKPTMKECKETIDKLIEENTHKIKNDTLINCIKSYINAKANILSPETIRKYSTYERLLDDKYKNMYIVDIDNITLQNMVNEYAFNHKPKSTRCFYGFISSVLKLFTDKTYKVILPQKVKTEIYIPTKEDVESILRESSGTKFFIPLCLACYGLRVGEILALTLDDISDEKIRVNKTVVRDMNNNTIIKTPKTTASNRIVPVPKEITDKIKRDKVICSVSRDALSTYLKRIQKKLNIPHFSLHKFRHYFASVLHSKNVSKSIIEAFGGWEVNSRVLDQVYTHNRTSPKIYRIFDLEKKYYG